MAIAPAGSPAWTRAASHTFYGGNVNKENYLSRGAIDPLTDVAAEEFSRAQSDLAACARTQPFAVITLQCNDTSPAAPTIWSVLMMTGVRLTSYPGDTPPTGFPSGARNGTGDITLTFASSYLDEFGVSGSFAPIQAKGTGASGSTFVGVTCEISGVTVVVRCFDSAGAAVADKYATITVW